jgi:LmbE family N-acetylglucosaminyl deacetylase
MRILYVFPHPDDESFGPALAIARQVREGHEAHLLTLTRGGATRQRHALGLDIGAMGEVRRREMERVAEVLGLASLTVLDFPDGGLAELDPRTLEAAVGDHLRRRSPEVVVTYAVHGISGHPDHLVTHAVVKRVFCALREAGGPPRLALFTLLPGDPTPGGPELRTSTPEQVDCAVGVDDDDVARARAALACYATYRTVIERHDPLARVGRTVVFELFGESHDPPLGSLTEELGVGRPG